MDGQRIWGDGVGYRILVHILLASEELVMAISVKGGLTVVSPPRDISTCTTDSVGMVT